MPPSRTGGGSCFRVSFPYFFVFLSKEGQKAERAEKPCSPFTPRTGQLSDIITGSPISLSMEEPFRQDQIHRQTADGAVHQVRIRLGFIYDFKDFDYTRTAYNLIRKHGYPHEFYYVNFTDMNRTYRFNPLDRRNIKDRTMLMQLMEDVLGALMPPTSKQDEWYTGALGILNGVAYRLWDEFPECCTLPHIVNFVMKADTGQLQEFLKLNDISAMMAGAYLKAEGSEKTQASYVSTLSNYVAKLATNENICYVLTGNDFDFNLIDPEHPKLFAISNNYATESVISPVIAMVMSIASRSFSMENRVPFVFILDEMTTFKVRDFEKLPSVLREYGAAFLLLTQSGAKLEKLYSKLDRSSIEANFGNIFLGRTQDVEALKYYPLFFGKYEKEKKSTSSGSSGGGRNSSVTISTQKEEIYESKDFASLEPGEFIGMGNRSNIKGHFRKKFRLFELEEEPLLSSRVQDGEGNI
ncbi:type IV secretion system DNA-binding domain-containing protein [Phocaeicola dorei]|nr:type IV secretion system DNA-binding domain-containing protein [Phocaeicola dorei]